MKVKKYAYITIISFAIASFGFAVAAFIGRGKYTGSSFSIASANMMLVKNLGMGTEPENLATEIPGPSFDNINSGWTADYPLQIYNDGTQTLQLISKSNYTTANDPDSLRETIYVEPFTWNDLNQNGVVDSGEKATSQGQKSLLKWKTEGGIDLGNISPGDLRSFVFTFYTQSVSDTKQGKTGIFDFEIEGVGQ